MGLSPGFVCDPDGAATWDLNFVFDMATMRRVKLHERVSFPPTLDMAPKPAKFDTALNLDTPRRVDTVLKPNTAVR